MVIENADIRFARETLQSFIDYVALLRAIDDLGLGDDLPLSLLVARVAAFDMAAISWCVLFGSDHKDHQEIHWKNLFKDDVDDFRTGLFSHLKMTEAAWKKYRKSLVDYRNQFGAHRDLNPTSKNWPHYTVGLEAAECYHRRLNDPFLKRLGEPWDSNTVQDEYEDRLGRIDKQLRERWLTA